MCTMLLDALARLAIDAGAIGVLAFALYYPRHGRSDLAVLLCLFNLGVFLAVIVIVGGEFGVSAGLGLFAVLSVMRMRSETFSARELGYFFTALALGRARGNALLPVIRRCAGRHSATGAFGGP
jgi:Domain of unknown function (DUF4956)